MKIAIVEDNDKNAITLQKHINMFFKENNMNHIIDIYNDGIAIVDNYKNNYDIIYFDVEMEVMDGMTAAKKIRQIDNEVLIVFVTNYIQFAIEGYSVNAIDFLLKPLDYFSFSEHFKKVIKKLSHKEQKHITIKVNSGLQKINLNELIYIESDGHYLNFYTFEQTFSVLETMKNMEQKLLENHFFRCNNCYLVNLKYVSSINKNIANVGPYNLQISRPRKKEFLKKLTQYIGDELA